MGKSFKVFVTRKIPAVGLRILEEAGYQVTVYSGDEPISHQALKEAVQEVDALICLLSDVIDQEILLNAPHLKVIANYAVGYNNIDIETATQKKIFVTNTPDVLTAATANLTWALILAVSRRVVEADRFVRAGRFEGWEPELFLGTEVSGKTLGIVGAGRIGQAVGRRAVGFDMNITYTAHNRKETFEQQTAAKFLDLDTLLKQSDYVTLHCPLTSETHHLLNEDRIFSIKKGAFLINTARGAVVDEEALAKALRQGHLAGAGLDVYEHEPEVHPDLLILPNVVVLPHIGSATHETRNKMAQMVAENVVSVLEKGRALNPVNVF